MLPELATETRADDDVAELASRMRGLVLVVLSGKPPERDRRARVAESSALHALVAPFAEARKPGSPAVQLVRVR